MQNYWWGGDFKTDVNAIEYDKFYVLGFLYNSSNSSRKIYINGFAEEETIAYSRNSTATNNTIAKTHDTVSTLEGYMSELIIFDRALTDEERKSVEKYLGKKWAISVS